MGYQRRLYDAYVDFKNRRARTAGNITRRNSRRAYDRVYGDDRLLDEYLAPERLAFYRKVAGVAAGLSPRSVIDVGCGTGHLLQQLVTMHVPQRIVGIDHARAGIRRASELVPAGEFRVASVYDIDEMEKFDLVICTEVLEHLSEPSAAMARLVSLCAPVGAILITVPDGASDTWEGHLNFWSQAELDEFLRPYGQPDVRQLGPNLLAVLRAVG